jgi:hypothetical protein
MPASLPPPGDSPQVPALERLQASLLEEADGAIRTLSEVSSNGETDAARVNAANSILDRVGLVKPKEPPESSGLPANVVMDAMIGLASVMGRQMSPAALERIRVVSPAASSVVQPRPVTPASRPKARPALVNAPDEEEPEPLVKMPRRKKITMPRRQEGQP